MITEKSQVAKLRAQNEMLRDLLIEATPFIAWWDTDGDNDATQAATHLLKQINRALQSADKTP